MQTVRKRLQDTQIVLKAVTHHLGPTIKIKIIYMCVYMCMYICTMCVYICVCMCLYIYIYVPLYTDIHSITFNRNQSSDWGYHPSRAFSKVPNSILPTYAYYYIYIITRINYIHIVGACESGKPNNQQFPKSLFLWVV